MSSVKTVANEPIKLDQLKFQPECSGPSYSQNAVAQVSEQSKRKALGPQVYSNQSCAVKSCKIPWPVNGLQVRARVDSLRYGFYGIRGFERLWYRSLRDCWGLRATVGLCIFLYGARLIRTSKSSCEFEKTIRNQEKKALSFCFLFFQIENLYPLYFSIHWKLGQVKEYRFQIKVDVVWGKKVACWRIVYHFLAAGQF